jgi:hypothetical protein
MLNHGRTDADGCRRNRDKAKWIRVAIVLLGALAGSAGTLVCAAFDEARAGDDKTSKAASSASSAANESRAAFGRIYAELADLAAQVMSGIDLSTPSESDLAVQKLRIDAANVDHQQAVLARQAAELALHEFEDGVAPLEKKALLAQVEQAKSELARAERAIPLARERYERFKHVKTGSAADLARGWQLEVSEAIARNELKRAQFALELAESNLKVFREFKYKQDLLNLRSRFEKARSNELAMKASWELEVSRLKVLERWGDSKARRLPISDERKRALELLSRAIPLEEKLSARLDQIKNDGGATEANSKEIAGSIDDLRQILERARDATQASEMVQLRAKLHRIGR